MNRKYLLMVAMLLFVSAAAFLPQIGRIGYMNDDWYLMYSVGAYGPRAFIDIFSVDRPARALVMIPAYALFGDNPLYYNLSAYAFRLFSALAFLWLLRMLFPRRDGATLLASLLFLIYPGFLSQVNGLDYQSHLVGLAAAHLSIALTVRAVLTERPTAKLGLHALSVLFGLLYLSQMEWYIGFELFRWGCVFLLSSRTGGTLLQKAGRAARWGYASLAIPGLFLIWRLFFFQSERGATDVGAQLERVASNPVRAVFGWVMQVIQDSFDTTISAWVTPISQLMGFIQPWGILLTFLAAAVIVFALGRWEREPDSREASQADVTKEALLLGLFIIVGGLIPIALVNRDVSFPFYSRYTLVSSAGVALTLVGLTLRLRGRILQYGCASLLVVVAMLTHHANAVKAARETVATREFWWQVSWRAPQFETNTTLIANYPGPALEEDYFIWGPANLIYHPEKGHEKNIQPGLFAAILNRGTVERVLARERQVYDKRKNIITYANFRNILVLTQPTSNSCVRILDGTSPEFSSGELDSVRAVGPYSELERVLIGETPHTPPTIVFGPEPQHGWCYYYQKADLARQRGRWNEVLRIGEQALGLGLEPGDLIEWMPFLQAYAINGQAERLSDLAPVLGADPNMAGQACQILKALTGLSLEVEKVVTAQYCAEQ